MTPELKLQALTDTFKQIETLVRPLPDEHVVDAIIRKLAEQQQTETRMQHYAMQVTTLREQLTNLQQQLHTTS